jgi:hypothetical protein
MLKCCRHTWKMGVIDVHTESNFNFKISQYNDRYFEMVLAVMVSLPLLLIKTMLNLISTNHDHIMNEFSMKTHSFKTTGAESALKLWSIASSVPHCMASSIAQAINRLALHVCLHDLTVKPR